MFDVEEAPQWVHDSDSKNCYRCRTEFSAFNRRHHCRACGQIFCNACSSKTAPIPKYGIEKEVRVCDVCFDKLNSNVPLPNENELPLEYLNSALYREAKASQDAAKSVSKSNSGSGISSSAASKSNEKTEEEFQEELQLALALSQSEIEAKKMETTQKSKSKSKSSSKSNGQSKSSSSSNNTNSLYANEPISSANATAPYYEASPSPQSSKKYKETSGRLK
jgi:growth factor-regulated tyrosine kinase substrate